MTRDEIYDHLAQVYLGKKTQKQEAEKKRQVNAWLVINIVITAVIFASSFYGLTAFLTSREDTFHNKVIYALSHGPIRVQYNLNYPYPPVKTFALSVPSVNASRYKNLQFSIRGLEEGYPGIVRIEIRNSRNEVASVFVENVDLDWRKLSLPLEKFQQISDWSTVSEVSFILESWNIEKKKGIVLIDDVCFSS